MKLIPNGMFTWPNRMKEIDSKWDVHLAEKNE